MCGICGVVHHDPSFAVPEEMLIAMRNVLEHRGPDDAGIYQAPGVALGSRRLAILDLSSLGHMPMRSADRRFWIAYNGEIYNYRELRDGLLARGHTFRSNTDTEVLLALYAERGPAMLEALNGMFAFAIWDAYERTLFVARDRLGVKPLYYALHGGALYFASEQKALFEAGVPARFDADTWEELLCFRYVAGERTPFVGVRRLLPGHFMLWRSGDLQLQRWWSLAERARSLRGSPPVDPVAWFRETFDSSVDLRRISDVPVGVLLSGGLDSSSVAASLAEQAGSGIASFTVRFDEPGYDEGPLAQQVAQRWGLDYQELWVPPGDLLGRLRAAAWLNDEPLAHGNDLHIWAISQHAKQRVTVLLSGEGADETLGGYVRYRPLAHAGLLQAARPFAPAIAALRAGGRVRKLGRMLALGPIQRFVLFNACDVLPTDLASLGMRPRKSFAYRERVLAEAEALYPGEPMRQAMYSDQHTFLCSILDRNDRMTMGASIECRVPFLDYRLVEGLAALPTSQLISSRESKHLLRSALGERLPEAIRRQPKWGFGVPWASYMRQNAELRDLVVALPDTAPVCDGPFERAAVRRAVAAFLAGDQGYDSLMRQLMMMVVWYQACVQAAPAHLATTLEIK